MKLIMFYKNVLNRLCKPTNTIAIILREDFLNCVFKFINIVFSNSITIIEWKFASLSSAYYVRYRLQTVLEVYVYSVQFYCKLRFCAAVINSLKILAQRKTYITIKKSPNTFSELVGKDA